MIYQDHIFLLLNQKKLILFPNVISSLPFCFELSFFISTLHSFSMIPYVFVSCRTHSSCEAERDLIYLIGFIVISLTFTISRIISLTWSRLILSSSNVKRAVFCISSYLFFTFGLIGSDAHHYRDVQQAYYQILLYFSLYKNLYLHCMRDVYNVMLTSLLYSTADVTCKHISDYLRVILVCVSLGRPRDTIHVPTHAHLLTYTLAPFSALI